MIAVVIGADAGGSEDGEGIGVPVTGGGVGTHAKSMIETDSVAQDGARTLIQGGPGIQTLVRPNSGTLFYNPVTNEFASVSTRGVIRTYYRPVGGLRYWLEQIRQP